MVLYKRNKEEWISIVHIREDIKYYFADFVRKGGEGYPPNP